MLILDAGHGGSDSGARSRDGKILEKNLNLALAGKIAEHLTGIPVTFTRTGDTTLDPTARAQRVRDSGARACISVHHNSYNGTARGMETIHSIHTDGKLARLLYNGIARIGIPGRRVYSRASTQQPGKDYYFIIRDTAPVETVIVEYGFIDSAADLALLTDPAVQDGLAAATAAAVRQYLGLGSAPAADAVDIVVGNTVIAGKLWEGVSYAPVRALAEALGYRVTWDGKRVIIGEG